MSKYIKYVLIVLLYTTIVSVTIIPKILSYIWYRSYNVTKSFETDYIFNIFDLVFSIVSADDIRDECIDECINDK